jgi:PAS domain S-box-containing protein
LVCVDADSAQVEFIKSGAIDAAFCQKREIFTYLAFQMLYAYNHGSETTGFTPGAINIPGNVDTGFLVVAKENIDSFNTELSIEEAFQQHELSQQLSLLSSMIENVEELALATDGRGSIVYANPATRRLCGYDKSELLGAPVEKIFNFTEEQKNQINQCLEQAGAKSFETAAVRVDGSLFPVQISISPLRSATNIRGLVIIAINISERKEAEAALYQSEERFRQMAEAIQEVFWMRTPDFREIVYLNPAFEKIWGQPRKKIYGSPDAFIDSIHPEDRMRILAEIRKTPKKNWDVGYRIQRPDGSIRWIRDRGLPIRDENGKISMFTGVALDMTQRKRSQMALIESHERFLTVLDSIDADIYVADLETYEILLVNKHMRDSFGENLVGKPCWKALRNEPEPCSICTNPKLLDSKDKPGDVHVWEGKNPVTGKWYINYDRAIKWVDGRLVHLQIATDISRIKDLEKESLRIQAQLQQAQKMEAIGTLAGGIAHDFNNILSAVLGYTEIALADAAKDSTLEKNLREVLKAGDRARDLVKQILTFSRQTEQELKPVQVKSIIKESLKLLRASLPTTIRIQSNIECDSAVLADPTQIHQVLMNLCTNAAHAMRESGGLLQIDLSEVVLDADFRNQYPDISAGSYIKLAVSDTGHGMAGSIQKRIFDPFFTTKEPGEGTGMGLAVVLGIVKSHGGAVTMESHIAMGSTFNVFLPLIQAEVEVKHSLQASIPSGTERILFVDDELALVDLGKKILERLGYHVTTRTSSIEALELFIEQPEKFDLVITDMTMPNMTGDELAGRFMEVRPDIAVILCTGYSERISREKAQSMGIKEFILKPLVMSELGRTIRTVLDGDAQNSD